MRQARLLTLLAKSTNTSFKMNILRIRKEKRKCFLYGDICHEGWGGAGVECQKPCHPVCKTVTIEKLRPISIPTHVIIGYTA